MLTRSGARVPCSALAAFALLAIATACRSKIEDETYAERATSVRDEKPLPPFAAPTFARGMPSLSFLVVGDQGWEGAPALRVAAAMAQKAAEAPIDFVLMPGDNFYRRGVESTADERWKRRFEDRYAAPSLQVPFYAVLGNHDYKGDTQAQIDYTRLSSRWRMPDEEYRFSRALDSGAHVEFFMIDTDPIVNGRFKSRAWIERLDAGLRASTARWKIVVGHHTVRSNGRHGDTGALVDLLEPVLAANAVDLYVSGHDHDQQILRTDACTFLVSGAGSGPRDTRWGPGTIVASADAGFAWIGMTADELWIELVSADEGSFFAHRIAKAAAAR